MAFPPGFDFVISGQNEEMETSLNSLYFALLLAIFLVYIVMASQFESLVHPFVIMFTVPLALIGVLLTLYVMQVALSIVVFIGLIMLAGIVVNNAIVLVDYINTLRRSGMAKMDAIVRAGGATASHSDDDFYHRSRIITNGTGGEMEPRFARPWR